MSGVTHLLRKLIRLAIAQGLQETLLAGVILVLGG
jgi:hypothetical protein